MTIPLNISENLNYLNKTGSGEDKINASKFITWVIIPQEISKWRYTISIKDGPSLDLSFDKKYLPYITKLIETLIVEKSVCEARMHILANCRAEVTKKWIIPLYQPDDIIFNPSTFLFSKNIVPWEFLSQIFKDSKQLDTLVNWINQVPPNYVPLSVIENSHNLTSYTKSASK